MLPCRRPSAAPCSAARSGPRRSGCALVGRPPRRAAGPGGAARGAAAEIAAGPPRQRPALWPARWSRASGSTPTGPPPRSWPACRGWGWPSPRPSWPSARPRGRSGRSRGSTGYLESVPGCSRPSLRTSHSPSRQALRSRQHPGSSHERHPLSAGGSAEPRPGPRRPSAKPQYRHAFRSRQSAGHRPCSRGGDLAGARGARAVRFGGGALAGAGTGPRGHQPAARPSGGPVSSASAQATRSGFRYCPAISRRASSNRETMATASGQRQQR